MLKKFYFVCLLFLLTGVLFSAQKVLRPGYNEFRFFMNEDEVISILKQTNKYQPAGVEPQVIADEIYLTKYINQDFIYSDWATGKIYQFHFYSNIPALKNVNKKTLYHLTDRFQDDFKRIVCPPSADKLRADWGYQFFFYDYESEYRLFAISISYKAEIDYDGKFYVISDYMFNDLVEKIYTTYGKPDHKPTIKHDKYVTKKYLSFYKQHKTSKYDIVVQANVSWVEFSGQKCNFQVTFMTPDYFSKYTKKYIANRKYKDVKLSNLIDF